MKSLEQQLSEKDEELRKLRGELRESPLPVALFGQLDQKLFDSRLPEAAQDSLRKQFQKKARLDGIDQAIIQERDLVRKLRANKNYTGQESKQTVDLVESYKLLGLSEREAGLAAGIEHAVADIQEPQRRLFGAAKGLGLSNLEADWFLKANRF